MLLEAMVVQGPPRMKDVFQHLMMGKMKKALRVWGECVPESYGVPQRNQAKRAFWEEGNSRQCEKLTKNVK